MNEEQKRSLERIIMDVIQRTNRDWDAAGQPREHVCADAFRIMQWLADQDPNHRRMIYPGTPTETQ